MDVITAPEVIATTHIPVRNSSFFFLNTIDCKKNVNAGVQRYNRREYRKISNYRSIKVFL